jgi:release factor glutamine methyltransferase
VAERALELARKAAAVFAERGFENPRLEAELLLAAVLGVKRLDLYLQHDRPVTAEELEHFRGSVRRRLKREPLQYVTGTAAFRKLELQVDRRVLIPRPETEVLVGVVLEWCTGRGAWPAVLDVGTGSGAIALSLAAEGQFERVVASDVSADALEVASRNAARSQLAARVEFRRGSLLEVVRPGERFGIIVSNPPYVAESEAAELMPEVRDWEPDVALYGGADGFRHIEALVSGSPACLEVGGLLALEIGATQGGAVQTHAAQAGSYAAVRILNDLAGRPRVAMLEVAAGQGLEVERTS